MAGYNDLDELLGGLQQSDMIILGARPALGKSSLAVNISPERGSKWLRWWAYSAWR